MSWLSLPCATHALVLCTFQLSKKHRNGRLLKVDWLDRLTFREIEVVNSKEKSSSNQMFLMIEFPRVVFRDQEYTVIYFEKVGEVPVL